ncbi:MAG: CidA/LrgA family protein [Clostridium sp.]|nr:CidA/LrgA family protein [Clostridium sp.]
MNIMGEIAIIFGICLLSEGISALLPFSFPASVISLLLLLLLLFTGAVKERHIQRVCHFLVSNMTFFFIAPCVGLMDHAGLLADCLLPFLFIALATTPLVYCVTGWTTQLLMRYVDKKEVRHD